MKKCKVHDNEESTTRHCKKKKKWSKAKDEEQCVPRSTKTNKNAEQGY
jgi:hypothetical protein